MIGGLGQFAIETTTPGTYEAVFVDTDLVAALGGARGRPVSEDVYLGTVLYASTPLLIE